MWAFDLIEIDDDDLRLEPLGARKATLGRVLSRAAPGLRLNEHMEEDGSGGQGGLATSALRRGRRPA
jgi:ATP-dependent DNA ligase